MFLGSSLAGAGRAAAREPLGAGSGPRPWGRQEESGRARQLQDENDKTFILKERNVHFNSVFCISAELAGF